MNEIVIEILKAAVITGVGGLLKLHFDLRSLSRDLDSAFQKIRLLENKNGSAPGPSTEAPK